jgi:hypothetical protein
VQPEAAELLVLAVAAVLFASVFAPATAPRRGLLLQGGTGLAATAAIAAVPTFDLALLILLGLGAVQAAISGRRTFAVRLRPPIVAVAILALALVLLRVEGPAVLQRFAAVGLVAGLAAAIGLLPYMHPFEKDEPVAASPVAWIAFVGPVLATVLVGRAQGLLSVDAGEAFAAMLIGLGILNMAWGAIAAWLTEDTAAAWRYSFLADWGLVLCGFGLTLSDGRRAALLVLFSLIVGRLPLYLASREPRTGGAAVKEGPINVVVAAALAGSAPFVGFAARVLLLRGATQLFWPLALVLGLAMLLWLPGSLRLGRSLGIPRGRRALGIALVLAVNVAAGLYPLSLLAAARL